MKRFIGIVCIIVMLLSAVTVVKAAANKDTEAPAVTRTNPADYDSDVMIDGYIQIRFSEDVKKGSNISKVMLLESDLKTVDYSYEIKNKLLVIKPKANLKYDTVYTVTLPSGAVQDLSGNKLTKAYSFSFITEKDPSKSTQGSDKAYKYLVELEINMDERLTDSKIEYYNYLLNSFGFDAVFRNVTEVTHDKADALKESPSPTPKAAKSDKVTPSPTPKAAKSDNVTTTPKAVKGDKVTPTPKVAK